MFTFVRTLDTIYLLNRFSIRQKEMTMNAQKKLKLKQVLERVSAIKQIILDRAMNNDLGFEDDDDFFLQSNSQIIIDANDLFNEVFESEEDNE